MRGPILFSGELEIVEIPRSEKGVYIENLLNLD